MGKSGNVFTAATWLVAEKRVTGGDCSDARGSNMKHGIHGEPPGDGCAGQTGNDLDLKLITVTHGCERFP